MADRCVVRGPPRLSSSSCLLAWFHENLVSKRSDLKAATQNLRTWGPSLWICLRDLRWNYGDWDLRYSMGLARPSRMWQAYSHHSTSDWASGGDATAGGRLWIGGTGLRKLCCLNWVIWGLGSLEKNAGGWTLHQRTFGQSSWDCWSLRWSEPKVANGCFQK